MILMSNWESPVCNPRVGIYDACEKSCLIINENVYIVQTYKKRIVNHKNIYRRLTWLLYNGDMHKWEICSSGLRTSTISPSTTRQSISATRWFCLILWETITVVIPFCFFSFTIVHSPVFFLNAASAACVTKI